MTMTGDREANPWVKWLRRWDSTQVLLTTKKGWAAYANAPERPRPPTLTRAEMTDLDEDTRKDYNAARGVWNVNCSVIRTPQLVSTHRILDQVMASNRRDSYRLRGAAAIDAAPTLGKTTIAATYAKGFYRTTMRRYGARTAQGHQRIPVVYVNLNAGSTLKQLNQALLRFYGHPAAERYTKAQLGSLVVDCAHACETRLVVIDDVHFIDQHHRIGREVSDHLKSLANEVPATFFFVGVGLREQEFFSEGRIGADAALAQTSRRVTRCEVAPFSMSTDAGVRTWMSLLTTLESHLLLADARPGMLTEHAEYLYARTQGCIGSLLALIDGACDEAISSGEETINANTLGLTVIDDAAEQLAQAV